MIATCIWWVIGTGALAALIGIFIGMVIALLFLGEEVDDPWV